MIMKHLKIAMCTQRKAQMHTNVIQPTLNSTLDLDMHLLCQNNCKKTRIENYSRIIRHFN